LRTQPEGLVLVKHERMVLPSQNVSLKVSSRHVDIGPKTSLHRMYYGFGSY